MSQREGNAGIDNDKLRRSATYASMVVAIILIIVKLLAYRLSGSVALLSSLFDSLFDLVASLVTALGVASAIRPPDREHRFGHGKAEPLAALAQSIFIIGSSGLLIYEAIKRFSYPEPVSHDGAAYAAMALSIFFTVALVWFQQRVVHKTGSTAIGADQVHYMGDLGINLAVIAAFALHHLTGLDWFDPVFGLLIAAGLLWSAFHILKRSLFSLMDAELPSEQRTKIRDIVLQQAGVHGVHDMRTRFDGDRIFIELHAEMDGEMTLRAAHELSVKISKAVTAEITNADIMVHQDPAGIIEERLDTKIERNMAQVEKK